MFEAYVTELGNTNCALLRGLDGHLRLLGADTRRISTDGGRTWHDDTPARVPGRTSTALRMLDGRLMLCVWDPEPAMLTNTRLGGTTYSIAFSEDEGATFSRRYALTPEIGCFYVMNDRFLRLASGRILLAICRHPDDRLDQALETCGMVTTAYSDDEGETWRFGEWHDGNYQEPMAVEAQDGTLLMFMRSHRGYLSVSRSADLGEHWSAPECTSIRMPCAPFAVKRDPYSGYIFLVWDDSFPAKKFQYPRTPLRMAVSRDNGRTFARVCELEGDPDCSYGYPCMLFEKDEIFVSYYENAYGREFCRAQHRVKLKVFQRSELQVEETVCKPLFAKEEVTL